MGKVKCHELRAVSKTELESQLEGLKQELAALRVAQVTNGSANRLMKIGVVRKSIARVLTVYNQQAKSKLREAFAGAKFVPKQLREKKTRAMRRALTPAQAAKKTVRATKKANYFPQRVFALKAAR